ncbi:unnamed protein product [Ilex paraguariensis]|uniref:Uncharacterized protein n=1 Tax=Ilex paraguariensis TaxID=185542 RepID=A0ABC8TEH9_9AQUA
MRSAQNLGQVYVTKGIFPPIKTHGQIGETLELYQGTNKVMEEILSRIHHDENLTLIRNTVELGNSKDKCQEASSTCGSVLNAMGLDDLDLGKARYYVTEPPKSPIHNTETDHPPHEPKNIESTSSTQDDPNQLQRDPSGLRLTIDFERMTLKEKSPRKRDLY